MVPFEALVIESAHSLDAGTSGWAGGSQIEILRSTVLSCASAGGASRPAATTAPNAAVASFFMSFFPPNSFALQTYRVYSPRRNGRFPADRVGRPRGVPGQGPAARRRAGAPSRLPRIGPARPRLRAPAAGHHLAPAGRDRRRAGRDDRAAARRSQRDRPADPAARRGAAPVPR